MEQTPLERCLEKRLASRGLFFGEGMYAHDMELAAAIDDIKNPPLPAHSSIEPEIKLLYSLFRQSPYQDDRFLNRNIALRRLTYNLYRGICYELIVSTKPSNIQHIGRIIARKKFEHELVRFYQLNEVLPHADVDYCRFLKGATLLMQIEHEPGGQTRITGIEEDIEQFPKYSMWWQWMQREFNDKKIPTQRLCSLAVEFLLGRPLIPKR